MGECSERKKERDGESSVVMCSPQENVSRIIDGEGHSDKVLDGNEDCFVGNWGRVILLLVTRNLAELGLCLRQ